MTKKGLNIAARQEEQKQEEERRKQQESKENNNINGVPIGTFDQNDVFKYREEKRCHRRHDVIGMFLGLCFLALLLAGVFGLGLTQSWDSPVPRGPAADNTTFSRFLPVPYRGNSSFWGSPDGIDEVDAWYYWKLKPKDVTHFTRLFPWLCYICHQLTVWSVLYLGQVAKTKDAILTGRTKYTGKMYRYGWMLFGINAVFSLVHLVQTHLTYDGLAQDASYASIDSSMLLLVILIMLVEYSERGWVFGWPSLYHTSTCSNILRLRLAPIYLLRKYHGYAISWVAVYILWYHPMENTYGHAIGICFAWLILIQGSLMYSKMHLNVWWRFFLQLSVAVYATISAAQATSVETVLRGTRTWPTYIFGYTFVAALTWIFILKVWRKMPNWTRIFPIVIVVGVTAGNYTWITWEDGQPFMRLYEILQIPGLYYIYSLFLWVLLQMMFMLYKSQRKRAYQMEDSLSACTKFVYMVAFVLVYAILIAAPVLIHHLNWRTERMTHLIVLLTINVIGVAIATLILLHLNPSVDVPRSSAARLDSMTYIGTLDRRRAKLARQLNNMNGNGSTYVGELSTVNTITTANTINTAMTMSDSSGHTNPAFAMDYSTLPRPGTVEADQDNMIRLLNMYSTI